MVLRAVKEFLQFETLAGIFLMLAAVVAIVLSNSAWATSYNSILNLNVSVVFGEMLALEKPLILWVNDGLMAIFFLMVGLEIKLEIIQGKLSRASQWVLPAAGAAGGMIVPALIFYYFNAGDGHSVRGWAIPTATDIAFSLGILGLFGKRVPIGLKVFLMTFAILDDLAAIVIIALFYTDHLSLLSIFFGIGFTLILLLLNYFKVSRISVYMAVATALWICVLKSGVHATLAGVIVAFIMPYSVPDPHHPEQDLKLTSMLIHHIHPWVAFFIVPLFAFLNAGVPLDGVTIEALTAPIPMGIALGLVAGKSFGIFCFTLFFVSIGMTTLPASVKWRHLFGVSMLGGVGFTMSLFIASLAYEKVAPALLMEARLGILLGSFAAMFLGSLILHLTLPKYKRVISIS